MNFNKWNNKMKPEESAAVIQKIISQLDLLVPVYLQNPEDAAISNGGAAVCIIDETGQVFGKLFGKDKIRCRHVFKVAWTKASQVWITGMKTGEFEKKVFNNEINDAEFGISKPDMIGWEGGQPIVLKDGTKLAAGFSGFRGIIDLEIVVKAVENLAI